MTGECGLEFLARDVERLGPSAVIDDTRVQEQDLQGFGGRFLRGGFFGGGFLRGRFFGGGLLGGGFLRGGFFGGRFLRGRLGGGFLRGGLLRRLVVVAAPAAINAPTANMAMSRRSRRMALWLLAELRIKT